MRNMDREERFKCMATLFERYKRSQEIERLIEETLRELEKEDE